MYTLCSAHGYLADWSERGTITFTDKVENAALFEGPAARRLQAILEGTAIMSVKGKLLLLSEVK